MTASLLIIGAGGHARSVIEVVESTGKYAVRGLIGHECEIGRSVLGYKVVGCDDDLPRIIKDTPNVLLGIGQIKSAGVREQMYRSLSGLGARFVTVIASSAVVSRHAKLGAGTVVMHHAVVNSKATVDENCIINTKAIVEHDAHIRQHSHISTAAVVNGNAQVGRGSFIGSGSILHEGVCIGSGVTIGAGLVVNTDIPDGYLLRNSQAIKRLDAMP